MTTGAYYNEIDPLAAQTMRELIAEGVIAPGIVDERDIRDIRPDELSGFTQCHFFAGGGIWSYALRRAGWPDNRPIWTGSCPCQPFSQAGKGGGFSDERHLWPAWQWLIEQCSPECVTGEQVADKGADPWLDLVQADLEGMGYAFGCTPLASAGFGAPNPRHRSFWLAHAPRIGHERSGAAWRRRDGLADGGNAGSVAYADGTRLEGRLGLSQRTDQQFTRSNGLADRVGHPVCDGAEPVSGNGNRAEGAVVGIDRCVPGASAAIGNASATGWLADADQDGCGKTRDGSIPSGNGGLVGDCPALGVANAVRAGRSKGWAGAGHGQVTGRGGASDRDPGPVNGFWRDADWLYCRDPGGPRWRPVDGGTFPLAPGSPERVGTLRISGNAINAEVATGFIEAVMDILDMDERLAA